MAPKRYTAFWAITLSMQSMHGVKWIVDVLGEKADMGLRMCVYALAAERRKRKRGSEREGEKER